MDELQIGGGSDVDMAPLFGQEGLAEGLHGLMEQHTQLWHHRTHLHNQCYRITSGMTLLQSTTPLTQTRYTHDGTVAAQWLRVLGQLALNTREVW